MLQKTLIPDQSAGSFDDLTTVMAAAPASAGQRKIAFRAFIVLVIITAVNIPLAHMQVAPIRYFGPVIQTAMCIANLLTAIVLFGQYSIYPQRALLTLGGGFVFSGLFALLHTLAFPETPGSDVLIGDRLNSGPWLFVFWQTSMPLAVIVYALSKDAGKTGNRSSRSTGFDIGATVTCVVTVTAALTWFATAGVGFLPPLHQSEMQRTPFVMNVSAFLTLLNVTALAALFVRRYTLLDQWLMVTLAAWLPNLMMASLFNSIRFSEGWYLARVYALVAGSVLLFVLLAETVSLYRRLANAVVRLRLAGLVEHRLAAIVESSDDAIISTDINDAITTWNKAAERLFGYSEAEAMGSPMTILLPADRQKEVETLQCIRCGERIDHFETVRQRKDGSLVNVALSTFLISESGKIVGTSNIIRDITERKRAEERDALLRLAQASTGVGVYGWDVRTKELRVSPELEELFGLKPGSMKNYSDFRDRVHPDDIVYVEVHRDTVIQKPQRFHHEFRIIRPDGETRWISSTGSAVYDEVTGEPIRILGSHFDITERKRADDALRAREAELQSVLNQTPFMLVRCSRDLRYRFISQAYARWIDRPREEVLGATIVETIGTTTFNMVRPYIEQVLQGVPVDFECERESPGGGRRYLSVAYRPELDAGGNVDGWIASLLDITERKRGDERQGLLLAELDHRVKNILAQVAVVASSTRQGSRSIRDFIRSLDGRIQSMAAAHTLLSESGWQNVGLGTLVRNQLAPYFTRTNVTISGIDVVVDSAQTQAIARVLHELATNAAKYGALSSRNGKVWVNWDLKPTGAATNLILVWRELGGPPVPSERPYSYGTNLIRNLIPHELGGMVDLVFATEGVNCRIEIPVRQP